MNFGFWKKSLAQDVFEHGALQLVSGLERLFRPCSVGDFCVVHLGGAVKDSTFARCHSRASPRTQTSVQTLILVHLTSLLQACVVSSSRVIQK